MTTVRATYQLALDVDGNELFDDALSDVTSDTVTPSPRGSLVKLAARGRAQSRPLTPPRAGGLTAELDNTASTYDPGVLTAGRFARLRATDPTTSTVHDLFRGPIDDPIQQPLLRRTVTQIRALGMLSALMNRRGISTALFEGITTDVMLGHVLDAAGWRKNLGPYIQGLADVVGYWPLGEASGDAIDGSGKGNDGTVTIGAGARDATALDDAGDGAIEFDAADTKVEIPDEANIQNVFDGGGWAFGIIDVDADGEGSQGRILDKVAWSVRVSSESGANLRIDFHYDFDGAADGHWHTAVDIPKDTTVGWIVSYDADAVGNNPTLYIIHGTTISTLTVGDGLTRATTPIGTRVTDVGSALVIGNNTGQAATFDGHIDEIALANAGITTAVAARLRARLQDAPRHLDTGKQTLEWAWLDHAENIFNYIARLLSTEGPGASLYEDGTGAIVFKNRHARVTEARSTAVQTTFNGAAGAAEPLISFPFSYNDGLKDVINTASMVRNLRSAAATGTLWSLGETLTLGANETWQKRIVQSQRIPFQAAIPPTSGAGDYTVSAGALASNPTLDRTSGSSCLLTLVAGPAGATITGLRVRGDSVPIDAEVEVADTLAAVGTDPERPPPPDFNVLPEVAVDGAQQLMNGLVSVRKDPRPTATFAVIAGRDAAAMTAALAREIGDRIRLVEPESGVDINAYVEQVAHQISAPARHLTVFGVEKATTAGPFVLDTSTLGGVDVLWV